jgi:SAM-dependent methyltransferase
MNEPTEQQIAQFYDTVYYQTATKHAIRPLAHYRTMLSFLRPLRADAAILDVGCGTGLFLRAAADAGLKAYGIDISQRAVDMAKHAVPEATIVRSAGESLPFESGTFDYIFYGGTLEHFLDVDKGLDEAVRVTKPDATFLIVVPNKNYWLWRVRGTAGTHQSDVKELLLDRAGWEALFKKHGIVPVRVHHDPWPWESVAIFKYKNPWRILRRAAYRLIWLFVPLRFTYQFCFVCQKTP